jgi:hypothetical protein
MSARDWKVSRLTEHKRTAEGRHECSRVVDGVPCPKRAVDFILGDPGDRLKARYPDGYPFWYCGEHYDEERRSK